MGLTVETRYDIGVEVQSIYNELRQLFKCTLTTHLYSVTATVLV